MFGNFIKGKGCDVILTVDIYCEGTTLWMGIAALKAYNMIIHSNSLYPHEFNLPFQWSNTNSPFDVPSMTCGKCQMFWPSILNSISHSRNDAGHHFISVQEMTEPYWSHYHLISIWSTAAHPNPKKDFREMVILTYLQGSASQQLFSHRSCFPAVFWLTLPIVWQISFKSHWVARPRSLNTLF